VANGMPTLIDEKIKYRDFFSDNEMIFYKDLNELIDKVNFYKRNEEKRIKIGINGKIKYQKIFNNQIVSDYIISKTLNIKSRYKNVWDN
jgi:spore maturation protein CgeB